jgi:peroxiredoxin family protein
MEKIGIVVSSDHPKSLAMGLNLGQVALTMDTEVFMYFTFDGLTHLTEGEKNLDPIQPLLDEGMPNPYDMLDQFVETGGDQVTTVACTTTLDMLDWDRESIDDDLTSEFAGAVTFLEAAGEADQVFTF